MFELEWMREFVLVLSIPLFASARLRENQFIFQNLFVLMASLWLVWLIHANLTKRYASEK